MFNNFTALLDQVFGFLGPLCNKLPEAESKKCQTALDRIFSPELCWNDFLQKQHECKEGDIVHEDDLDDAAPAAEALEDTSAIDALKAEFNKATGGMLDLLLDLMRGKYLEDCRSFSQEQQKVAQAVSSAAAAEKNATSDLELVKCLCVVVHAFDTSTKSVSISATTPAPSLIQSSEEDSLARERIWKQIQGERRKYVTFSVCAKVTKDALNQAFRACGKVWGHSGQLNTSHRLLFASADLMVEDATEPWTAQAAPAADAWTAVSEFCSNTTGSTDFSLLCDGRMREVRRIQDFWRLIYLLI